MEVHCSVSENNPSFLILIRLRSNPFQIATYTPTSFVFPNSCRFPTRTLNRCLQLPKTCLLQPSLFLSLSEIYSDSCLKRSNSSFIRVSPRAQLVWIENARGGGLNFNPPFNMVSGLSTPPARYGLLSPSQYGWDSENARWKEKGATPIPPCSIA